MEGGKVSSWFGRRAYSSQETCAILLCICFENSKCLISKIFFETFLVDARPHVISRI
jgi:hypothetical protein